MNSDPGVNIGAINTARRTHVRHNDQEFAGFELTQAFRSRFAADNLVSAAFQHSAHITHYRGLILDEQNRQMFRFSNRCTHGLVTPTAAERNASSFTPGSRTVNVAPSAPT